MILLKTSAKVCINKSIRDIFLARLEIYFPDYAKNVGLLNGTVI